MIDFTKLKNEYDVYWSLHSKTNTINSIINIYNDYAGELSFSPSLLLNVENLSSLYAVENFQDIQVVADNVSYSDLVQWYSTYLTNLINEITDNEKKNDAIANKSFFDTLISGAESYKNFWWQTIPETILSETKKVVSNVSESIGTGLSNITSPLILPLIIIAIIIIGGIFFMKEIQ